MAINGLEFSNGLIWLDEPKSVYYPGQLISGKVNFELNNPLKLLYINVAFNGEANVDWSEEEFETYNGVKRRKEVKYVGREVYFDFTLCICGGDGVTVLPTGAHSIPFLYQLPPNLPSTFQGDKGQISYKITATLLHQDGVTKENLVKKIDIVAPLDLNTEENKEPIQMEFEELYSCNWSCTSRPLYIGIRAPHSGYSPGESIPFTVDARNEASVEVTKIIFEVVKRTRYLSQQPISSVIPPDELVVSMKKGPILSKTNRQYIFELKLPDFIAPNLDSCGIIDIGFFLKVRMKLSGCNEDLLGETSLCLGLTPIGSTADVRTTHPMADCLPISPIPDTTQTQSSVNAEPPAYNSVFVQNYPNNLQICPPAPIPYPTVANVIDKSMFGSKNNIAGAFETHTPHNVTQNPAPIPGFITYPYVAPGQNEQPYPGYPQGPAPYPNVPQGQNSSYNGAQFPNLPPGQNYPLQPLSTVPSAPPP